MQDMWGTTYLLHETGNSTALKLNMTPIQQSCCNTS